MGLRRSLSKQDFGFPSLAKMVVYTETENCVKRCGACSSLGNEAGLQAEGLNCHHTCTKQQIDVMLPGGQVLPGQCICAMERKRQVMQMKSRLSLHEHEHEPSGEPQAGGAPSSLSRSSAGPLSPATSASLTSPRSMATSPSLRLPRSHHQQPPGPAPHAHHILSKDASLHGELAREQFTETSFPHCGGFPGMGHMRSMKTMHNSKMRFHW